ncbi:YbaB/EbfC family nucleoid-associated protein [Candidatus Gracilibacteria bacterium]|nr:YbaB/EbfC family nucleoid-associated protein [Candidatus Gracilibacteria bacterium]
MFGQMGDMYKLQKEAKRIKKELAQTHISAEVDGVKVVVSGEQEMVSVDFLEESILQDPKKLSKAIIEAFNKAVKKSQMVAAEKMKAVMGGFPGLGGQ